MLEWQDVAGGRARAVQIPNEGATWVRVSDDGTVHFFTGVSSPVELDAATPTEGLDAFLDRLLPVDAIDIVSRSFGGDDPGPMADG